MKGTFVTLGNARQPFTRLIDALRSLTCLPEPVLIQAGHTPVPDPPHSWSVFDFCSMDEYECVIAAARLVITQAGGGGVLHAVQTRHIPVMVPRRASFGEVVDDHQIAWSKHLAGLGKAVAVPDLAEIEAAIDLALQFQAELQAMPPVEPPMLAMIREALRR